MSTKLSTKKLSFNPYNNQRLALLCGTLNENISQIENYYNVSIAQRGNVFHITGKPNSIDHAGTFLSKLYQETKTDETLTPAKVYLFLKEQTEKPTIRGRDIADDTSLKTKRLTITPRGEHQNHYVQNMRKSPINFATGPAGTGKTYLAVAAACEALEKGQVQRLVLVRPAVEAGEKLGFLPGAMEEKVSPYLRPLYDALYEMMGFETVDSMIENNAIEVAPLAFMRGRTLNDSFIILDEAQNTTVEQMKMFLTRLGFGSTMVITGDTTQVDLAKGITSGLSHAANILEGVTGVSFNKFTAKDAVRHPLVKSIIEAYEEQDHDKR